jgi:hypothetical protein
VSLNSAVPGQTFGPTYENRVKPSPRDDFKDGGPDVSVKRCINEMHYFPLARDLPHHLDNPLGIQDPVFGLLGNAAAVLPDGFLIKDSGSGD